MVTLSPMTVAPVCRVGDPLQITCTASVEFIRWSIVVVNEQGMDDEITTFSNSRDPSQQVTPVVVNSTTFTFMRTSAQGVLPLINTLYINSVSIGLNGTVVSCMDVANPMISASTTIYIIDTSQCELDIKSSLLGSSFTIAFVSLLLYTLKISSTHQC